MTRKFIAELFGTAVLVLVGCGTAVFAGEAVGTVGIALAFGLSIIAVAWVIGDISGCHLNPAVSLAMLICGKMTFTEFLVYFCGQLLGAFGGTGIIYLISHFYSLKAGAYGANSVNGSVSGAMIVEGVMTAIFVLAILGVTSNPKNTYAPIIIGFTLTMVHIFSIGLTGTSVNPARSIAPAVFAGGLYLKEMWIFIVAPFAGAAFAALLYRYFSYKDDSAEG
ncbi:MAG: aquaporin [Clostridia bacterium]|nr:aquaporin [Clostridia bacterium]